jgi:glucokinase
VILAGDVGATKILLEVGEIRSGKWEALLARRYPTAEVEDFPALLTSFLGEWTRMRSKSPRIESAAFGVAGPAQDNAVKLTSHPWGVDGTKIGTRLLIPHVKVVNDLEAAAHGIAWLNARDTLVIQAGKASPTDPRVVMGIGTGLGVAYLVPDDKGLRAVAGEGGHVSFGPTSAEQMELCRWLQHRHGRASNEDVCSGRGLSNLFEFMREMNPHPDDARGEEYTPERISERAADKSDARCVAAMDLFVQCAGAIAGDHALTVMARGGVYLVGGVAGKIVNALQEGRFRESFCAKGAHSAAMMKIPVRVVRNERLAVIGAARLAEL